MVRPGFVLLSWRIRRLARQINGTGIVALGLIACTLAFHFSAVAPMQARRQALREDVTREATEAAARPQVAQRDAGADLAAFYRAIPARESAPGLLQRLHNLARAHNLAVDRSEYRPVPDPGGRLTRYQILVPARGTYPEVRGFLARAARELPGLALDSVSFQRQKIGDPVLDVQLRFTLFLGGGA